jgi:hypothetical protein
MGLLDVTAAERTGSGSEIDAVGAQLMAAP